MAGVVGQLKPVLSVVGLRKAFKRVVLKGVALAVQPGACAAILGKNGAGKTTLLTCLLGLQRYSGSVTFTGQEGLVSNERTFFGILDRPLLYPRCTVRQNLAYFDRRILGDHDLGLMVPPEWLSLKAGALSTGQTKRVVLAMAFASQAPILVFDEIANGLDQ